MRSALVRESRGRREPHAIRTYAGLERYPGPWDEKRAAHLLRRTLFGPTKSQISFAAGTSLDNSVALLLFDQVMPNPPIDPTTGLTWIGAAFDSASDSRYQGYLKSWWLGLMATSGFSIREKMVLFWHNHFVSEYATVLDSRLMYQQNALFRHYALGNIKDLVKAVTRDPAMLVYLNGYRNRGDGSNTPDENYARELQELFTIGKGPQIGPGDYTNYTEQDVKAAAHVLTGWRTDSYRNATNPAVTSYFYPAWHDTKGKGFSNAYQNAQIIGGSDGERELSDLVELIFRQPETARFLCRKLYRWFVYYEIDAATEVYVIEPLAAYMRNVNYELKPVLDVLFHSAHFFDLNNIGCQIKNPVDFLVGTLSTLEASIPAPDTQTTAFYALMASLSNSATNLQMPLMDPPNVAGWPAYYQTPDFYRLWLNTITLPSRWAFSDSAINGIRVSGATVVVDPILMAKKVSNPGDPRILVGELAQLIFSLDITANQLEYLISSVLIPGLPDYEWTVYWNAYVTDPTNSQKRTTVVKSLNALLKFMMRMAEYELA
jgi:uncharacterized protein (DUF1800 family)